MQILKQLLIPITKHPFQIKHPALSHYINISIQWILSEYRTIHKGTKKLKKLRTFTDVWKWIKMLDAINLHLYLDLLIFVLHN